MKRRDSQRGTKLRNEAKAHRGVIDFEELDFLDGHMHV